MIALFFGGSRRITTATSLYCYGDSKTSPLTPGLCDCVFDCQGRDRFGLEKCSPESEAGRHCSSCCGHVSFHCTSATTATLGDLSLGRSISRGLLLLLLNPRGDKIGFWGLFVCLCLFVLATVAASVLADPIEIDPMRVRAPHLHTTFAFSRETAALEPQPLLFLDLISSGGDCWFRFRPESAALTW